MLKQLLGEIKIITMAKQDDVMTRLGIMEYRQDNQDNVINNFSDLFKKNNDTVSNIINFQKIQERDIDNLKKSVDANMLLVNELANTYKTNSQKDNFKKFYFDKWRKYLYIVGFICFVFGGLADETTKLKILETAWSKF
jgi:sugar-specific transcriptional regulator TrmB